MHFQVLGLWEKTKQSEIDAFCSSLGTFKYAVQTGSKLVPMVWSFKVNSTSLGSIMAWWYLEMFILHQSNFKSVSIFYFGLYLQIVKVRFFLFQAIRPQQEWNMLHHIGGRACSCTCLAVSSSLSEAVTAGEDGQINFLKLDQRHPVRTIGKNSLKSSF